MSDGMDTAGNRWVQAPHQSGPMTTGSITGVSIAPNEEVNWAWQTNADGTRSIRGYTISKTGCPDALQRTNCPKCNTQLVHDENDVYDRCLSCGWYARRTG